MSKTPRRPYEAPKMQCYTSTQILQSMGPALAGYDRAATREVIDMALPPQGNAKTR